MKNMMIASFTRSRGVLLFSAGGRGRQRIRLRAISIAADSAYKATHTIMQATKDTRLNTHTHTTSATHLHHTILKVDAVTCLATLRAPGPILCWDQLRRENRALQRSVLRRGRGLRCNGIWSTCGRVLGGCARDPEEPPDQPGTSSVRAEPRGGKRDAAVRLAHARGLLT